ncbi:hypothetical protein [Runella sp. SP2]|uniref:hypothetical protein n=1 Tax=Runella sp. SP2 TaxID=2268026 RepID=UPI000F07B196|nr:hypothetical protein [Runella sp. SP2]AYQ31428.1 hypothetical protein DTQ70_04190 [Runella sp. SP2]
MEGQNTAATATDEKDKKIVELSQELEAKDKIIASLEAEITQLKSEKGAAPKAPTVKVAKKTYMVSIPRFNFKGKVYTSADVVNDQKLADELVKEDSGVLVEVTN